MKYGFGIDLGGTTAKIGFLDETGKLIRKWEIPTVKEDGGSRILPDIAGSVLDCLNENGIQKSSIFGLGIGVPGPVDKQGVVNKCHNLNWGVFNIEEKLSSLTGFPVKAANDANVAALGECWMGGGKGYENLLLVTLGTGVGGGIVLGGRILTGAHGSAGEIGHLVADRSDPLPCNCGNRGCAEQYCSATGIVTLAKRHLEENDIPSSLRTVSPLTCKDIFDAGKLGDKAALAILEEFFSYLGQLLANVCNTIDPDIVVLGGGVSRAGEYLLEGARRHFDKHVFHSIRGTALTLATLGNDAGTYGAFKLALQSFLG